MRTTGALLLATALAVTGCSGQADDEPKAEQAPATITVAGDLTLTDSSVLRYNEGTNCGGTGGYDDIRAGAQVVVRDSAGQAIGLGHLEEGVPENQVTCRFAFTVDDVPKTEGLYSVEVSHRGGISFSGDDASALRLTLG